MASSLRRRATLVAVGFHTAEDAINALEVALRGEAAVTSDVA
jgi:hypothetical protein